jgi:hypothetical protein
VKKLETPHAIPGELRLGTITPASSRVDHERGSVDDALRPLFALYGTLVFRSLPLLSIRTSSFHPTQIE